MKTIVTDDASRESSPATGATKEASPHSPDAKGQASSPEGDEKTETPTEAEQLDELLAKEGGTENEEVESPATEEKEETAEAEAEDAPLKDKSSAEEAAAGAEDDLSQQQEQEQQQEQAAETAFKDRPEWQAAIKLVPADKQKEMRKILRTVLTRESQLTESLEKAKPALAVSQRMSRAVGAEGVENAVALVELWNRGDERAETMLTELLTDLQTRRGARLSSADLVTKAAGLKQKLEGGLIEQADYDEGMGLLKEVEKSRAGWKQSKAQTDEAERATTEQRQEKLITDRTVAMNTWEKTKAGKDPDYGKIQKDVINRAMLKVQEAQEKAGRLLAPGEMVAILEEAHAEAKAYAMQFQPRRKPITPVRGRDLSGNSQRKPKTDMEVLEELERKHNGD